MSVYLRKYATATTIDFALYKLDGTGLKTDAASATGDITLYRDEGAVETLDADAFVDEGAIYSLALSEAEMTASRIIIAIVDQSNPQVWLDKTLIVETYGNASAQHAFDLDTAQQAVTVAAINDIDLSATMKTSIETACDASLNNAVPAEPAADSINQRVKARDDLITDSKIAAQVKGQDNIDFGALQKASITTAANTAENLVNALQVLKGKWAISGTTLTFYASDGTTPLYTFTLDSATAPTSRTPA